MPKVSLSKICKRVKRCRALRASAPNWNLKGEPRLSSRKTGSIFFHMTWKHESKQASAEMKEEERVPLGLKMLVQPPPIQGTHDHQPPPYKGHNHGTFFPAT
jgi:hypothetical protein